MGWRLAIAPTAIRSLPTWSFPALSLSLILRILFIYKFSSPLFRRWPRDECIAHIRARPTHSQGWVTLGLYTHIHTLRGGCCIYILQLAKASEAGCTPFNNSNPAQFPEKKVCSLREREGYSRTAPSPPCWIHKYVYTARLYILTAVVYITLPRVWVDKTVCVVRRASRRFINAMLYGRLL